MNRVVRYALVFMEFQKGGGTFEAALLLASALALDFAERFEGPLKLAGEPLGVHAKGGQQGNLDLGVGVLGEEIGFEHRDAVEAPSGVGQLLSEVGFGGVGGLVFVEELAAVDLICGGVLGGEHRRSGG
ncbi:MAG: hypothetical protein WBE37_04950 [Bryobacteraceae bacterium]